jgi:pentatricopeptide repeat protein
MKINDLKPHLVIYNILINGMCKYGKIQYVNKLFFWLPDEGFQPNIYTYNPLISGLCEQGLIIEAHTF